MARQLTIRPIEIPYSKDAKTLQSSLAFHGYVRGPGAKLVLTPQLTASGKYKTGLDEDALYIQRMPKEAQEVEIALIRELKKELVEAFGNDVDFGPKSDIWNAFSLGNIKVSAIPLSNEKYTLDTASGPQALLDYAWLRVDGRLASSLESFNRRECQDCRYYIENAEAEARVLYNKKKEINNAVLKLDKLTPARRKMLASVLGLPVTEYTTEDQVYNLLDSLIKQGSFEKGEYKGQESVKVFNELADITPEHLEVKNLVNQAIRYNIYREVGGRIEEGTVTIAARKEDLVKELLVEANQMKRLSLETKVKHKKQALEQ